MGMIKRADIESYTRDAYVMDLGDLEKRGDALVEAANAKAVQIIRDAQRERERLISGAQDQGHAEGFDAGQREGHTQGFEQGLAQAREEHTHQLGQLEAMWTEQLAYFEQHRDAMLEAARMQVVELAAMIARRVIRRAIELDPGIVCGQLVAVLSSVTESTRLVVRVHPEDAQRAQAELPGLIDRFVSCEHAQIVTDPTLEPGSCIACTSTGGVIDASIATQLDRIVGALLPGGHAGDAVGGLDARRGEDTNDTSYTNNTSGIDDRKEDAA